MRIGVTGHIGRTPESARPIYDELLRVLCTLPAVHGISCLTPGSDEIFVAAVRAAGGTYEVVLPYPGYRRDDESLLRGASRVTFAAPTSAGIAAYAVASDEVLRRRGTTLLALSDRPDESTVSPSGESLLDASMTIYGSDISAYLSRLS